ncbi:MAG: hypothetical protein AAGH64_03105, partial [Planctomycetota bacterium]
MNAARTVSAIAVFAVVGIALVLAQPSLTPPAGPIEESGRFGTRTELDERSAPPADGFAHVISEPGSYVLAGDVDAGSGSGVRIDASNVTLDLNGFTVRGDGTNPMSVGIAPPRPITEPLDITGVTVRNGKVTGFS